MSVRGGERRRRGPLLPKSGRGWRPSYDRGHDDRELPAPINTRVGVEFGAWISDDGLTLIFSRGLEPPGESGVFVSARAAERDGWPEPRRLPIPYGWGVTVDPTGEDLVYIVDDDPVRVPMVLLGL